MTDIREWRIASEMNEDGDRLYWSNEDGWVDYESATLFTNMERQCLRAPEGAAYWTTV